MPNVAAKKLSQQSAESSLPADTTFPVLLTPQAQANPALRNPRGTAQAVAGLLSPYLSGPNLRKDGFKSIRCLTRTDPRFDPSFDVALDELDTLESCLGGRCQVEYEGEYVLVYDGAPRSTPGPMCWAHGNMQPPTPLVPCKWVPYGSDEAARANVREWADTVDDWGLDELLTAPLRGRDAFFRVLAAGGPFPAPSGVIDAYYRQTAPPASPTATFQALTQDEAVALMDDEQVARQRLYAITFPVAIGRPEELTVYTVGYDRVTFNSSAALIDQANLEHTIPVTVDVRNGTIVNIQGQIEALSSPFYSADPDDLGKLKGYAAFELACNTAGNYNFVQIQTATPVELTQDLTVLGLSLRGYSRQTTIIGVPPGRTFTINGSLELYNMRLEASPGPGSLTYGTIIGLPSQLHASQLNGPFSANNATCTAIDSDLSIATLTGPGTLVLLGNTDYSDAQITAATAAGMTVVDKRPNQRVTTPNDIEITDPTKGIIMTVAGTRVRMRISGTASARTLTFTDL